MTYKPQLVFRCYTLTGDAHPDYPDTYTLRIESNSDIKRRIDIENTFFRNSGIVCTYRRECKLVKHTPSDWGCGWYYSLLVTTVNGKGMTFGNCDIDIPESIPRSLPDELDVNIATDEPVDIPLLDCLVPRCNPKYDDNHPSKCKCGGLPSKDTRPCPYDYEMKSGVSPKLCNCCETCRKACLENI